MSHAQHHLDWLATGSGPVAPGAAAAQNEREVQILSAIRQLSDEGADAQLRLLLVRLRPSAN